MLVKLHTECLGKVWDEVVVVPDDELVGMDEEDIVEYVEELYVRPWALSKTKQTWDFEVVNDETIQ